MRNWRLWLAIGLLACLSGCETMRAIDQWKCDALGICCFGTRPSCPPSYPAAFPPACPPTVGAACEPAVVCPPAACDPCAPGTGYPTYMPVQ
jgi:hypothetical protein